MKNDRQMPASMTAVSEWLSARATADSPPRIM